MAKKTILVSDLSGERIPDGSGATVRIIFFDRRRGVRVLDVTDAEAETLAAPTSISRTRSKPAGTRKATLEEAKILVSDLFRTREWIPSDEIHSKLESRVSEPMFGRVKSALEIEHRRVGGRHGHVEWRRPRVSI
jgi:hypothetical protein